MKLLLDENLSDRIIPHIIDLYPNAEHVKTLALTNTDDAIIWEYAKLNDYTIVSSERLPRLISRSIEACSNSLNLV